MSTELTIVVPTYNERDNISPLLDSIRAVLGDIVWEVIFVDDDSSDNTAGLVREIARQHPGVRCIQRLKRRGLSSACVEGILASSSPFVCVMDADLQHDEKLLPRMLSALKNDNLDLVIGSRYMESGSTGSLSSYRIFISRLATFLGGFVSIKEVKDPMSGYFMFRRDYFEKIMRDLSGKGFKILLDMLASTRSSLRVIELPYTMRSRVRGTSKLDATVMWDFFTLVADKLLGKLLPIRFFLFATVGLIGVLVHLTSLWLLHRLVGIDFLTAQITGTYLTMTSNFILNNRITYRDVRLKGVYFFQGLISFYIYCSFGALINVVLSGYLYQTAFSWWLAGVLGAVAGAVWNYAVTAVLTWKVERV